MARALRFQAFVHLRFWGECVSTAVYLLNRLPTVLLKASKEFFVSRDAVFQEDIFPFKHTNTGLFPIFPVVELVEPDPPKPSTVSAPVHSPSNVTSDDASQSLSSSSARDPSPQPVQPRRSSRESRPPVWMGDYIVQQKSSSCPYPLSNYVIYDHLTLAYMSSLAAYSAIIEPKTYAEASIDPLWVDAMKSEISALESNNTCIVVDLPPDKVPIGCKGVFKDKYKST
ncbi:PREDICTED: uncharacterized protein LOC109218177 [Nicotiana attenuata]|uniref:uncharacterized protein LOC109218177 n=1 Tax=Nicotiana attenuata TaxID=49451 RepID=UPI000905D5AA|nr:PREDICTED: uncharacterized protein LOC109218177 [Nicotiana attenuata]